MYDVIIIGGGPAGSTMGSYLSKAGIKNLILEGHNQPRPHVGESLVLSTMRVFGELGLIDKMDQAGFPKKYGASWRDFSGKEHSGFGGTRLKFRKNRFKLFRHHFGFD